MNTDEIFTKARSKIGPALVHSMFQSEGSYTQNGEYYILSPLRPDHRTGTFHINENSGVYYDHSTDEGGDFIDLVSGAYNISLLEAAKKIILETEGPFYITAASGANKKNTTEKKEYPEPILSIPQSTEVIEKLKETVSKSWFCELWGKPTKIYRYFSSKNEFRFVVIRYEQESDNSKKKRKKNDILFYYSIEKTWRAHRHEKLFPCEPFGIEQCIGNILPILIVEGEKCTVIAREALKGKYCVVSWFGGSNGLKNTDWAAFAKICKDREVFIWADADSQLDKYGNLIPREQQPGYKAALLIKGFIYWAQILEIYRAFPIDTDPHGYDVADYIEEGKNPETFISEYKPYKKVEYRIEPYAIYKAIIDRLYSTYNLVQFEGWFWEYSERLHFFRRREFSDIQCNAQRFLEETSLQWIIASKTDPTTFFSKVMQYMKRHSIGYIDDNPFKDSAVSEAVHFANGAVLFKKDGLEWMSREKYSEGNFRNLYPIFCLNVNVDFENFEKVKPEEDFPAFYFFIKEMIPKDYLNSLSEKEQAKAISDTLIYFSEILAYTISSTKVNQYFFGLCGSERTGKSFFVSIIKELIGPEFCAERRVKDLDNRFALSGLWQKKVYIEPDLKTRELLPEDFLKSYAGESITTIEAKNKESLDGVRMSLSIFVVSNYDFQVHGMDGIARRMMLIPFKNKIKNYDTRLLDKICGKYPHGNEAPEHLEGEQFDERPGIIALALKGWEKYRKDNFFITPPDWIKNYKARWEIDANSTLQFINDYFISKNDLYDVARKDIYDKYTSWCGDENRKPLGKKNFFEEVRKYDFIKEFKINNNWFYRYDGSQSEDINENDIPDENITFD